MQWNFLLMWVYHFPEANRSYATADKDTFSGRMSWDMIYCSCPPSQPIWRDVDKITLKRYHLFFIILMRWWSQPCVCGMLMSVLLQPPNFLEYHPSSLPSLFSLILSSTAPSPLSNPLHKCTRVHTSADKNSPWHLGNLFFLVKTQRCRSSLRSPKLHLPSVTH